MTTRECIVCGEPFQLRRSDSVACSEVCRDEMKSSAGRTHYRRNATAIKAQSKKWQRDNVERMQVTKKKWRRSNPEKERARWTRSNHRISAIVRAVRELGLI